MTRLTFSIGEHKTRQNTTAIVVGVLPNGMLCGGVKSAGEDYIACLWNQFGRFDGDRDTVLDLMPPPRTFWLCAGEVFDNMVDAQKEQNATGGEVIRVVEDRSDA